MFDISVRFAADILVMGFTDIDWGGGTHHDLLIYFGGLIETKGWFWAPELSHSASNMWDPGPSKTGPSTGQVQGSRCEPLYLKYIYSAPLVSTQQMSCLHVP